MAEDLNQQEPTAEEKAKFEADVLKAAEDAMKSPTTSIESVLFTESTVPRTSLFFPS